LTNLQACQSFRRLVSLMTGILGIKNPLRGKSTNKRLVPMPRQLNKHLLNPVSVLFIWQSLFQKSGSLSVHYRTNRRVTRAIYNSKEFAVHCACWGSPMHLLRMKRRSFVRRATATILKRAQLALLLCGLLGIASKLLVSGGTLASPQCYRLQSG
jgi:hypothetical protein